MSQAILDPLSCWTGTSTDDAVHISVTKYNVVSSSLLSQKAGAGSAVQATRVMNKPGTSNKQKFRINI